MRKGFELMKNIKVFLKVIFIIIFWEAIILVGNFLNISYGAEIQNANIITLRNDREPRIQFIKNDKNYLYIILHDDLGINLKKTHVTMDGKECELVLIENTAIFLDILRDIPLCKLYLFCYNKQIGKPINI